MRCRNRCAVGVLLGSICHVTIASDITSEQDFFQELPVVISASRLEQPISEAPSAMTVISRDMIRASGARRIGDVFKLVPGMYVSYEDAHTPIVAYRGTTDTLARRMQVLLDGRTVYLPPYGQVDWSELPIELDDIERVEVIRGPSAASHGSNSVQGVISIFTRNPSSHISQVSVRKGELGVEDMTARVSGGGEKWDYRFTLAQRGDDGFEGLFNANGTQKPLNDTNKNKLVNARAAYQINKNNSLDFNLGYSETDRMKGNVGLSLGHPDTLRVAHARQNFQQISWLHNLENMGDVQLNYYHIARRARDDRPFTGTPFWINDDTKIDRQELVLQSTLLFADKNRLVLGMGVRNDKVDSPNNFREKINWWEYHLFAHDEWRMTPKSLLNLGAMVELNGLSQLRLSPRAAYNYHLTPQHTLRASTSVAYRNPEMVEEAGYSRYQVGPLMLRDYTAQGGLGPEKIWSREIGYIGSLKDGAVTIDARIYRDLLQNVIWVDVVPMAGAVGGRTRNFKAVFDAVYTGVEGTFKYKINTRNNLTVNYAYQFVNSNAAGQATSPLFQPTLSKYVNLYEKTVPEVSVSVLYSHQLWEGLQLSGGFYHQEPVMTMDGGSLQPLTRRLDLRLAKRFGLPGGKIGGEISLVVQNALNDFYTESNEDFANRRHTYLTATLDF